MPSLFVQVQLENDSLLPIDRVVNTFSFTTADVLPATLLDIKTRLLQFYNTPPVGQPDAIKGLLSPVLNALLGRIKIYNRADVKPRVPILDSDFVLGTLPVGNAFPNEVSLVLSFRGLTIPGGVAARRRGRLYLGPLVTAYSELSNSDVRPTIIAQQIVAASAERLMNNISLGTKWVVHSTVNNNDVEILNGHVDNAFDTQRRRGRKPTSRVVYGSF